METICARPDCLKLVAAKHGFCLPDWRAIPLDVQREIWRSFREHDDNTHALFLRSVGERLALHADALPWPVPVARAW